MTIITIDGKLGSGGRDIGIELARQLKFDYLDRWILAETAQRLGATVDVLSQKEMETGDLSEKVSKILKNLLERSALVGAGGDPSFGPGIEAILADSAYGKISPITDVHDLDDEKYIKMIREVIFHFAEIGNSIIVGRGGCFILKSKPNVIHLATIAGIDARISRIKSRHHINDEEAVNFITASDNGRQAFHTKYFQSDPNDSSNYDMVINTSRISVPHALKIVKEYIKIHKN